jgi:hypothetical protein
LHTESYLEQSSSGDPFFLRGEERKGKRSDLRTKEEGWIGVEKRRGGNIRDCERAW